MSFYVLESPRDVQGGAVTDYLPTKPVHDGEAPKCPCCGDHVGMIPWLPPHRAVLEVWGRQFGDIAFGPGDELLVSEHFAVLYETNGLTGLSSFNEVCIARVKRRGRARVRGQPPKYYCVSVVRSRVAVDGKASGLVLEEPWTCEECRGGFLVRATRVVLEEHSWSGEDIFFARGLPGTILVSQRFKEFFERNQINNGMLIPASEYSFDLYPSRPH